MLSSFLLQFKTGICACCLIQLSRLQTYIATHLQKATLMDTRQRQHPGVNTNTNTVSRPALSRPMRPGSHSVTCNIKASLICSSSHVIYAILCWLYPSVFYIQIQLNLTSLNSILGMGRFWPSRCFKNPEGQ